MKLDESDKRDFSWSKREERNSSVVKTLSVNDSKIPTTFIVLAPDRLEFGENVDVLVGVFHIMWEDMPRRRTYRSCLRELVTRSGESLGVSLLCGDADLLQRSSSK